MSETLKLKRRARVNWTAQERAEWLALFEKSEQTVTEHQLIAHVNHILRAKPLSDADAEGLSSKHIDNRQQADSRSIDHA